MSFIWPTMLVFLFLVPALVGLYLWVQQRQRQRVAQYGNLGFVQEALGRRPGRRRYVPALLFLVGLIILILALARPQATVSLPSIEGTVILAFDVSGSMAADDLEPTRMEAAKVAAVSFVERQPETVQIGVVTFSDGGFAVQAPTNNQDAILSAIARLEPQRGTSLGQGIVSSLNTIALDAGVELQMPTPGPDGPNPGELDEQIPADALFNNAVIILLTDGENTTNPDPLEAAQAAAQHGVRIYPIGIGSAAGTILEVNGFTVHTRLDEPTLQQIADLTNGAYFRAEDEENLRTIYDNIDLQLVVKEEQTEVTSIFAGASILILLIGGAYSLFWFNRVP